MSRPSFAKNLLLLILSCFCCSCLKQELPVPLKPKGSAQTASVEMEEDYRWQVYYSLKNNAVVSKNLYTAWDLGFESGANGRRIIINGAKFRMAVYATNKFNLNEVSHHDTIGLTPKMDQASGSLDSTAFGSWKEQEVYIINRGTDPLGNNLGMVKLQVLQVNNTSYTISFAPIDATDSHTIDIHKEEQYNFSFLSFDDGGKVITIEPPKADWDIVLTKYTHYYTDLNMPYSVVGCLLNHYNTSAGIDSLSASFEEINLSSSNNITFSNLRNSIGFEWKSYDINTGKYSVAANMYYIIHSSEGIFYKLHFTGFYQSGIKGVPQWEYQRL